MRRNARRQRTKSRSIQSSVQILLTVSGLVFLLAGLLLAASGASVSSAVGSVSDRWDDSQRPTEDDVEPANDDSADADGSNETDGGGDDGDEPAETDGSDDETDGGNESESDTDDQTHALTVITETQDGEQIDDATVSVTGGSANEVQTVGGNGEATFELEDGEFTITADADGYNATETAVRIDGEDDAVTLTLEERDSTDDGTGDDSDGPYTLAVTVEDQDGNSIDNATVEIEDEDEFLSSGEEKDVDDDGEVEFERDDGVYTITATAAGYASTEETVEIDGSGEATTLTLEAADD